MLLSIIKKARLLGRKRAFLLCCKVQTPIHTVYEFASTTAVLRTAVPGAD